MCNSCQKEIMCIARVFHPPSNGQGCCFNQEGNNTCKKISSKNNVAPKTGGVNNKLKVYIDHRVAIEFRETNFGQGNKIDRWIIIRKKGVIIVRYNMLVNNSFGRTQVKNDTENFVG